MQIYKQYFVPFILLLVLIAMFFIPAIQQDPGYHNFSDQRTLLGVPNFFNVMSNIPYLLIGLPVALLLISKTVVTGILLDGWNKKHGN